MNARQIFGVQFALAPVVYALVAARYVSPAAFAVPAAYGDLLAADLALLALAALRRRWTPALALVGILNVGGVLDLVHALARGVSPGVSLGAAYDVPPLAVPARLVTHAMIFRLLLRSRAVARAS